MSRPHRGRFEAWLRGGQTVGHTFDMTVEVVGRLGLIAVLMALGFAMAVNNRASARQQTAGWLTAEAMILDRIGPPFPQQVTATAADGSTHAVGVHEVWQDAALAEPAKAYWGYARAGLIGWLAACWMVGVVAFYIFTSKGQEKMKPRQIRGQEVARLSELRREIDIFNVEEARRRKRVDFIPPRLAGVPYPFETELEHTLIVGAPGAGKSQAIHQLLDSIRERGHRAIVFDPELDFIRHHYDASVDTILNPFDARSPGWSPFFDAADTPDWVKLGHAIFKDPKSGDPYWVNVARSLFAWTGYRLREINPNVGLTEALDLLFGPPSKLKAFLEGTPAAMHLAGLEGGGARVASLISVLAEGVEPLIYLHGAKGRFSIKAWVNRPVKGDETDGGFLFLSAPESHMDALRPLLGFWSEIAVSALLSRHDSARTTTWFVLDEFHSAGRIEKLADGPQRLRKYGGAVVLGFQQVSQLQDLYGPDKARTIIGQCQTKLILRAGDFDTATLMSEQLGRRVMRRVEENTSYGANSIRDGVGLTPKEELEPVVLPEDVQNFPKFQGMIRVSNARATKPFPIAPIRLEYVPRKDVATGFVRAEADPVRAYISQQVARAGGGAQGGGKESPGPGDSQSPTKPEPDAPQGGPAPEALTTTTKLPVDEPVTAVTTNAEPDEPPPDNPAPDNPAPDKPAPDKPAPDKPAPDKAVEATSSLRQATKRLFRPIAPEAIRGRPDEGRDEPTAVEARLQDEAVPSPAQASVDPNPQAAQVGGGPEPEMQASDVSGEDGAAASGEPGVQKEMRPRRVDLPTEEAERLRRREEEDETYRNMRTADLRRDPDRHSDGARTSVMQREGEMLREEQGRGDYLAGQYVAGQYLAGQYLAGQYLGSLETATGAEVAYAEQHRHEILETIVEVGVGAVVGAHLRLGGVGRAAAGEEPSADPQLELDLTGSDRPHPSVPDRSAEEGPQQRTIDVDRDDGRGADDPDPADISNAEVDNRAEDPRHRHRRSLRHSSEVAAEYEAQPDPNPVPGRDPDRDRDPELEIGR